MTEIARFKEAIQHLTQLFDTFDKIAANVFQTPVGDGETASLSSYEEKTSMLRSIMPQRNLLWNTLDKNTFEIEEFLINWKKFIKCINKLPFAATADERLRSELQFLQSVIERINEGKLKMK